MDKVNLNSKCYIQNYNENFSKRWWKSANYSSPKANSFGIFSVKYNLLNRIAFDSNILLTHSERSLHSPPVLRQVAYEFTHTVRVSVSNNEYPSSH